MTKPNFTSINVLLDRSGSMKSLVKDTIGGFNQFLEDQKATPGEAMFSLGLFDDKFDSVYDAVPLDQVQPLTDKVYFARGYTSLLDAVGTSINALGVKLAAMPEEERPSKVIFLIVTDGKENSSKEFAIEQIKEMASHQRDVYSWEFVFMGANIDSFDTGTSLGFAGANTLNYTASPAGTRRLYKDVSKGLRSYRISAQSSKVNFFDQDSDQKVDADPVAQAADPVDSNS